MELILVYHNIINFLLKVNINFGKWLSLKVAEYEAQLEIKKFLSTGKGFLDIRKLSNKVKSYIIYDQDIIDERMSICKDCDEYFVATSQCKICKCITHLKARVSTESCPKNKWKAIRN